MTKKEIIKTIASDMTLSQNVVHEVVQRVFEEIISSLVRDKRIELRNFGVFEVKVRAPRKARNPRTNQRLDVPRRAVVAFKPGKEMVERIGSLSLREVSGAFRERLSEPPGRALDRSPDQPSDQERPWKSDHGKH